MKKLLNLTNEVLNQISEEHYNKIDDLYPIKVTDHIISEITLKNSTRLAAQFLPDARELDANEGIGAFFPEEIHNTEIVVQKYPNRCMIYTTGVCFAHCRHCSRKEKWHEKNNFSYSLFDKAYLYIKQNSHLEDVLLTGGDALANSDENIEYMIEKLSSIPHLKSIRLATRAFTSFPDRITSKLCAILEKYKKVVVVTQFNCSEEFSEKTVNAIDSIQRTGAPILNQSVLLKGINDEYRLIKDLVSNCAAYRVIPYYLFHCFNVKSIGHFRTNVEIGEKIINNLVGNIGGWWIPRYILIPDSTGIKIPLCPNGLIENSDSGIKVKDFKGRVLKYK
ncbi:KamA family radical SAM protein [Paenibacillus sp. S150]|uniref:KamA family radical SAM protein n=1 Tax=Paenibacillus sp. S150 TaxID=2749826 RepID=UPI001C57E350|nr:KamA family radical SAM protein [Paenibacillus sp. S150]MBW4083106.1 KamA family radical SAM protein [Paenibacillus sp. S150]